ncbi:hypothetical protein ENSA5_47320 [Enhygromyxa salina]|uniref:DUF3352 domain-containing protein n=1 Tax=Enhygromyxa salina TaxID=215803 RepID=A0A2S9XIW4_9BACT|nr:hypothetical protein [Enhygromyxa salina]PRP92819.1 hypothetical protein ENSA5_47320 [Enhygromyxa salina]
MFAPRVRFVPRLSALACAALLWVSACQKHGGKDTDGQASGDGQAGDGDGSSARAKDDRIPELSGAPVGLQPGYVDGALFYASWRAGAMQELLHSLPMSPREVRDVAELGALIGADLRVDDVLAHLGVDPDARISMSVRPVLTWSAELRDAVENDSPALKELEGRGGNHVSVVEIAPKAGAAVEEVAPSEVPLSPAARELERKAKSLGVHARVHLPVATPGKIDRVVGLMARELQDPRWATTCAALGPTRACGGESDGVMVLRDVPGGLQLDLLLTFVGDYETPDDEFRRALIQQALTVPAAASAPALAALRGDAVMLVDGPGVVSALRGAALARVIRGLSAPEEIYGLDRLREREGALERLHDTERMFEGVTVELALSGDSMVATGKWLASDSGRQRMAAVFELSEIDADVPSIAALCEGALLCGRSRGLPDRARFSSLARGVYADPEELARLLDRHEDEAAAVLMLETWPNAIGSLAQLPGKVFEAPESFVVQNVIDVSSRVLGAGFSIRSLNETRHTVTGDWVGYARMSAADLSTLRGFLQMVDARMSPTSLSGVEGRVEFTPIPDSDVAGNFYEIFDPPAATGAWGWAVLADGDDRVRWLAGLAHDDGAVPLLYLEAVDLWRLFASFDELREDSSFAQSWLSRRWIRGQVGLGADGAPEVRVAMGKLE